jgi:hypothetical protein
MTSSLTVLLLALPPFWHCWPTVSGQQTFSKLKLINYLCINMSQAGLMDLEVSLQKIPYQVL